MFDSDRLVFMIICLDVQYDNDCGTAVAAGICFEDWGDAEPCAEYRVEVEGVADYVPGEFYKRELPCLLEVLGKVRREIEYIIVDGYVWLKEGKAGLGAYLYHSVDGVSKGHWCR